MSDKNDNNKIDGLEFKYCGSQDLEVKEEMVNGVPVGIVKGYIATWSIDRGNDKFMRGAFAESIAEHREKNRQIRFKNRHREIIGGFPIEKVKEDRRGLFGVGHINLDVQLGREAFALAKQGVLSDFSIGFSVVDFEMKDDIRIINKAIIWEGSIVDEPMNVNANITEVKNVSQFQDLKIADRKINWDPEAALSRIREFTKSDDVPDPDYKNAFILFDSKESSSFDAYKFQIADIVKGRMTVVPDAIFSVADILQDASSDLQEEDRAKAIRHVERYYAKMNLDSPFSSDEKQYYVSDDVVNWTPRQLEKYLKASGGMSKSAAKIIASNMQKTKIDNKKIDNEEKLDYKQLNKLLTVQSISMKDVLSELKLMK